MAISSKQKQIFKFPYTSYDALICDGAVRSGKTSMMSISFLLWAMSCFSGCAFAFCGKSVGAVERNLVRPLLATKYIQQNFSLRYNRSGHVITVKRGEKENHFYLFGGRDESSAALIQGVTLGGVLLDEVALMPRSFVEQALARCSVEGAKLWFNCNPDSPLHWFKKEWIEKATEKNVLHIHFTMDDNPGLSEETKARYRGMYAGVFYQRFIQGLWVMGDGLIYDMFDSTENIYSDPPIDILSRYTRFVSCDYGTTNPCIFLDIYDDGEKILVNREYRWDSKEEQRQKTDEEYADDMMVFLENRFCPIIVDPSAASFILALQRRGLYVIPATNDVLDGIRKTGVMLKQRKLLIHQKNCDGLIGELGAYSWDTKAAQGGTERPVKQQDHALDALRYYINYLPDWRFE